MKTTKYEIDVLDVKAGDAILIHFFDENEREYIVSIDAGNYQDGKMISDFIKEHYGKRTIDIAICTHCDADHFGGYIWMLEDIRSQPSSSVKIRNFLINDPGLHVDRSRYNTTQSFNVAVKQAREVYTLKDTSKNLIALIDDNQNINRGEAFSDGGNYKNIWGIFEIMGPTKKYYESLIPYFRSVHTIAYTDSETDDNIVCEAEGCLSKAMDDAADDTSPHNQSSIIILFKPSNKKKYLFTGDMGEDAYNNIGAIDKFRLRNLELLKIPHHGSKHNLKSHMINHFNPKKAVISTEKYGKYLSKSVVNALNKKGILLSSTHHPFRGSIQYREGMPLHDDYIPAEPLL